MVSRDLMHSMVTNQITFYQRIFYIRTSDETLLGTWLSSRNFFRGQNLLLCKFSIVFGPNFGGGQKSLRGQTASGDAPYGGKPGYHHFYLTEQSRCNIMYEQHNMSQFTGCPATWKTRKCQEISMQAEKVREFFKKPEKSVLLCEIHFQPI